MKVNVVRDPVRQRYNIYVQLQPGKYLAPFNPLGTGFNIVDVEPGSEPPLFLWLGDEIAWAVAQGIIEGEANDRPSRDAVNDAREVRDRMITLVETVVNGTHLRRID